MNAFPCMLDNARVLDSICIALGEMQVTVRISHELVEQSRETIEHARLLCAHALDVKRCWHQTIESRRAAQSDVLQAQRSRMKRCRPWEI